MAKHLQHFVWNRMANQPVEELYAILERKEAERRHGGDFWWGMRVSLGKEIYKSIGRFGGTLPVVFSPSKGKRVYEEGLGKTFLWNGYIDENRVEHPIPNHALVFGPKGRWGTFALVCRCDHPVDHLRDFNFDPSRCHTVATGRPPGPYTALLEGNLDCDHSGGAHKKGFCAFLVQPWYVELVRERELKKHELDQIKRWRKWDDWLKLVQMIRA